MIYPQKLGLFPPQACLPTVLGSEAFVLFLQLVPKHRPPLFSQRYHALQEDFFFSPPIPRQSLTVIIPGSRCFPSSPNFARKNPFLSTLTGGPRPDLVVGFLSQTHRPPHVTSHLPSSLKVSTSIHFFQFGNFHQGSPLTPTPVS